MSNHIALNRKSQAKITRRQLDRFISFICNTQIPRQLKKRSYTRHVRDTMYNILQLWFKQPGKEVDLDQAIEVWVHNLAEKQGCDRTTIYRATAKLRKMGLLVYCYQLANPGKEFGPSIYKLGGVLKRLWKWFFTRAIRLYTPCCRSATLPPRRTKAPVWLGRVFRKIFHKGQNNANIESSKAAIIHKVINFPLDGDNKLWRSELGKLISELN